MSSSKVAEILERNDRLGEQGIAFVQSFMAVFILVLHLISAAQNNWETFNLGTLFFIASIITSSLYRLKLTQHEKFETGKFLFLTVLDGLLIFALLLSYNVAYQLEITAIFKSPSIILFVIYTAARLVRFDPTEVLVAGGTVLGGWVSLFFVAVMLDGSIASSYIEYLTTQKLLVGAALEMAIGYACFLVILATTVAAARRFVARTATVEDLEEANVRAEQNAANFESLFASSNDAIVIVNQDGQVQRANPALGELFGYRADQLVGESATVLMSAKDAGLLRAAIEEYLQTGSNNLVGESFESVGKHSDGTSIDIELSITEFSAFGEVMFAGFIRDIRKRKLSEQIEERAKAQFQSAVDAAMDAIIIIDEEGLVTGYNPAAEEIFGFPQSEMLGRRLSETIIPPRYRHAHDNGMDHYIKTGEGPVLNSRIEIEGMHASGEELQIELVIREIDGISGRRFFGYARDITERKHNEEMLVHAKEEAELATRAKARFLAIMSHEIRTALNGMLGVVGLLSDTRLNKEQERLINVAEDSGRSLLGIINDILDFSKLEAGKFKIEPNPYRIGLLLQSIKDLVEPQAEKKGLLFECDTQIEFERVFNGDADRIRQVLLNLVWNAVKFTDSGKVAVFVEEVERTKGQYLRFSVSDTGIGVPDQKKNQLFSEFANITQVMHGNFQGTGLGLAISKAFVEAMDGEIGFENKEDRGSIFWFEVPLELGEERLLQQNTGVVFSPNYRGLAGIRVLVADDNLTNQLIVRKYLKRAGCHVDVANNGKEAIEQYSKGKPDLVLMDISMPEMNGYEATAGIRYLSPEDKNVPIIAFTAYATQQDKERIRAAGMDDHITKPFSRDNLIGTIIKHLPNMASSETSESVLEEGETELIASLADGLGLDIDVLSGTLTGMDDAAVSEIVAQFGADLSRYLELARDGLVDGDWDKLEKASHGLKGACGMFGAIELKEVSGRVNTMCRNGLQENIKTEANRLIEKAETLVAQDKFEDILKKAASGR